MSHETVGKDHFERASHHSLTNDRSSAARRCKVCKLFGQASRVSRRGE